MDRPDKTPEAMFQRVLHVDEILARVLTASGIATLEEVAYVPMAELLGIQGLDEPEAQRIRKHARMFLIREAVGSEDDGDTVGA